MSSHNKCIILLSIFLTWVPAVAADAGSEMMMNAYVSEFAARQLELFLPRGQFSLAVKVTPKRTGSESMRLPLGTATLTSDEMSSIEASGSESTSKLLSRIEKIEMTVGLSKQVPESVRTLIKSTLNDTMALQAKRGDLVNLVELPEGYSVAWTAPVPTPEQAKPERKNLSSVELILCGIAAVFLFLSLGIIYLSFRQMGARISSEARLVSSAIKEAADASTGGGAPFQSSSLSAQSIPPMAHLKSGEADENIWKKIDNDSIVAFCMDCLDHPQYRSVPGILVDSLLESERSTEIQNHLSSRGYESQGLTGLQYQPREVSALFQSHQSDYRRSGRSPMSKQLLLVPFDKMVELVKNSKPIQSAMIINSLTPLRRSRVLKDLSVGYKLELAALASKPMSMVEHKTAELELTSALEKFSEYRPKEAQFHSMGYLSQVLLKAESFAEDEQFHLTATSGQSGYVSVLSALSSFTSEDWASENLQELAIAYSGYSESVQNELIGKFSGKRQDWLKNFMSKFASAKPEFTLPQVVQVHERIKTRLMVDSERSLKEESHAAA